MKPIAAGNHRAVTYCGFDTASSEWTILTRDAGAAVLAEFIYLGERLADQFGSLHMGSISSGLLNIFGDPDAAVQYSIMLVDLWLSVHHGSDWPNIPTRAGCHFGECTRVADTSVWTGRALRLVEHVASVAHPNTVFATSSVLDTMDL